MSLPPLPQFAIRILTIIKNTLLRGLPSCLSYYRLRLGLDAQKPRSDRVLDRAKCRDRIVPELREV